jgi:hypothetical protein
MATMAQEDYFEGTRVVVRVFAWAAKETKELRGRAGGLEKTLGSLPFRDMQGECSRFVGSHDDVMLPPGPHAIRVGAYIIRPGAQERKFEMPLGVGQFRVGMVAVRLLDGHACAGRGGIIRAEHISSDCPKYMVLSGGAPHRQK